MTRDYVIQTHPCHEALAKANLESRGFEVYLPTVIEEIRYGRMHEKRTTVMTPLFPGYLFVRLDLACEPWRAVGAVRGVKRMLGRDGEHPTPLPRGALDDLKARFLAGEFVRRVDTHEVSAGDRVTVTQGVFQGHTGVCTTSRGERIKVLLNLLSGAISVDLTAMSVAVSA